MAALEEYASVFAAYGHWMICCSLQVESSWKVHKEMERRLEARPNVQHPRDTKWNRMDKKAQAKENTERSDPVQDGDAKADEHVVTKGCSYHDGVTADEALLFGWARR